MSFHHNLKLGISCLQAYIVFTADDITKGKAMTTLALNAANRSFVFLGIFVDALDKAITMAKAVHHDSPSAADMDKVRAIANTI